MAGKRSSHLRDTIKKMFRKISQNTQLRNFIKDRLQHRRFPKNFAKLLRAPILKNICERLALRKGRFWENVLLGETKWWKYEWISRAPLVKSTQKDLVSPVPWRGFSSEAIVHRCSFKTGVLKNFANFLPKYRCWSLF